MKNKTPIILVNSLNVDRGGVTKSALTYANLLVEECKKVYICTFLYQARHKKIIDTMYQEGLLDKRVVVLNMFEDFKPNKNNKAVTHKVKEKKYIEFKANSKDNLSYRYFKKGLYKKYKLFNEDGELLLIDYMTDSRQRYLREEYNSLGLVSRKRHMDLTHNKTRLDQYFDNKGACYLSIWINPKTMKEEKFYHFTKKPVQYSSINGLREKWLNTVIKYIKEPVFIIDKRDIDNLMKNIKHPNLKKIAVLHNNHYKSPYETGAEIKPSFNFLFNNSDLFDKIVCLTERQKKDLEKEFQLKNKTVVIPHTVETIENSSKISNKTTYTPFLAVTIARYENQKRLDEAIRAFKLVVNKIPEAKYDIYGTGGQEENLVKLIKELRLQNNVRLKGYTNDNLDKFKEASCSILTSDFEGFGRVVAESLYAGTPVVSYNTNYGPSDIVRDSIDGYIVEKGNKQELANKVIEIFENEKLHSQLSERALEVKKRFSFKQFEKNWIELLKKL